MKIESTNEYIHGSSEEEQNRLSQLNRLTNSSFIEYLGDCDGLKICDFGCGLGNLLIEITRQYDNVEAVGLEISSEQYQGALKNVQGNKNIQLFNRNALKSELSSNSFDLTYCRYLLEHVSDPAGLVKEMKRVTKPGGKIISQENDLYNVIYYPKIEGQEEVSKAYCDLQLSMGGDPYIGRKLFDIYKKAGIKKIQLDYQPEIYTEQEPHLYKMWMNNALIIFKGVEKQLKDGRLIDKDLFNRVCEEFQRRIDNPNGVALFHWNRAAGYC